MSKVKNASNKYKHWVPTRLFRLAEQIDFAKDESDLSAVANELIELANELEQIMETQPPGQDDFVSYADLASNIETCKVQCGFNGLVETRIELRGEYAAKLRDIWYRRVRK